MGRNKLPIRKLETSNRRKVTYSKRRPGIIKKARELSILCDADVLLLTFSTEGKPSLFLGENRNFEEIIIRYGNISPEERNTRRKESLDALKKAFKKVDHEVNMEELLNQGSPPVKEGTEQLRAYTNEINQFLNMLGPLADIPNIKEIEDVNVLDNMEKRLLDLVDSIRDQKCVSVMNQLLPQNETSPFRCAMNGGQQTMLPHNPIPSQSTDTDTTMFNNGYNIMNANQELLINQMDGIHQTLIDQSTGLIALTENVASMKNNKIDDILQNNIGGINGNVNGNGNTNNNFEMKGLPEASSNESDDFLNNFGPQWFFPMS